MPKLYPSSTYSCFEAIMRSSRLFSPCTLRDMFCFGQGSRLVAYLRYDGFSPCTQKWKLFWTRERERERECKIKTLIWVLSCIYLSRYSRTARHFSPCSQWSFVGLEIICMAISFPWLDPFLILCYITYITHIAAHPFAENFSFLLCKLVNSLEKTTNWGRGGTRRAHSTD